MINELRTNCIIHHGWTKATYLREIDNKKFVIENQAELIKIAVEIGLSNASIPKILQDIDLKDRKIVIIYKTTYHSSSYSGVNKIDSAASKINIVRFSFPTGFSLPTMGGEALILSVPKNNNEIQVESQDINVLEEQEYKEWNYQEVDKKVKESIAKSTYDTDYEFELSYEVGRNGLSEEEIKNRSVFLNASEEKQVEILKKFPLYRAQYELKNKVKETFDAVYKRLMGKSY